MRYHSGIVIGAMNINENYLREDRRAWAAVIYGPISKIEKRHERVKNGVYQSTIDFGIRINGFAWVDYGITPNGDLSTKPVPRAYFKRSMICRVATAREKRLDLRETVELLKPNTMVLCTGQLRMKVMSPKYTEWRFLVATITPAAPVLQQGPITEAILDKCAIPDWFDDEGIFDDLEETT